MDGRVANGGIAYLGENGRKGGRDGGIMERGGSREGREVDEREGRERREAGERK